VTGRLQNRGEQRPVASPDIDQDVELAEVVGGDHRGAFAPVNAGHRHVEDSRFLRILGEMVKQRFPLNLRIGRFPGADTVNQLPERTILVLARHDRGGPLRAGHITAETFRQRRECERSRLDFRKHSQTGQRTQQSIERPGLTTGLGSEFVRMPGTGGEPIGQLELRRDIKALGQPVPGQHLHDLRGGRGLRHVGEAS